MTGRSLAMIHLVLLICLSPTSGQVVELSDADFKIQLNEIDTALVMFYAPWCGHCKALKPEFEKAAESLVKYDPPVHLLKIDCTEAGQKTCKKFGVTGYPTLKIFQKGVFYKEYEGARDRRGLVTYMERQVSPSAREIATKEEFDKFVSQGNIAVMGFFKEPSALKDVYLLVADNLREKLAFGITNMSEIAGDKDGVVLFRPKQLTSKFEPSQIVYQGLESTADLQTWLKNNIHGLVDHRTPENKDEFKNPLVIAYYNVDYNMNSKNTNYWRNRILTVAKDFAKDFSFAVSSVDDFQKEFDTLNKEYSYEASQKPIIVALSKDHKKYVMDDDFSVENFTTFLTKLKANELEPVIKSEPVPEDNSKPVKVAVARNFEEVVLNNDQDTMVEFYAPWCGHCRNLAPVWDELGDKMADEDVTIAKMDATNNDFPPTFKIEGFPTIFWLPKDKKDAPALYNGGRNLNDFIRFIAKHATKELKNYDKKGNPKKKEEL